MPDHHHDEHGTSNIKVAFFLNLAFTIIELVGGLITNSVAILSDALHDLGDSLGLASSWYFQKISSRQRDQKFSFGYRRFSLLGALINSLMLIVGSVFILQEAIPRLLEPETVDTQGMLIFAIIGVAVNGLAFLRLHRGHSLNEKAVALHLLEDVLGWVAVLIGSIVIHFFNIPIIDPILSLAITLFILFNIIKNLRRSFRVILQGVPSDINIKEVEAKINELPEVDEVHDIHIWTLDGEFHVITLHVVLKQNFTAEHFINTKNKVRQLLNDYGLDHSTIEMEHYTEKCELEEC